MQPFLRRPPMPIEGSSRGLPPRARLREKPFISSAPGRPGTQISTKLPEAILYSSLGALQGIPLDAIFSNPRTLLRDHQICCCWLRFLYRAGNEGVGDAGGSAWRRRQARETRVFGGALKSVLGGVGTPQWHLNDYQRNEQYVKKFGFMFICVMDKFEWLWFANEYSCGSGHVYVSG